MGRVVVNFELPDELEGSDFLLLHGLTVEFEQLAVALRDLAATIALNVASLDDMRSGLAKDESEAAWHLRGWCEKLAWANHSAAEQIEYVRIFFGRGAPHLAEPQKQRTIQ